VIADRTACSILTLFIVIATSRPLNKKIRLLSVRGSNNYCRSASALCTPLLFMLHLQSHRSRQADSDCQSRADCVIVDKRASDSISRPWARYKLLYCIV